MLKTCDEHVQPFAPTFMAMFRRDRLPHCSTLPRFLAELDHAAAEALRMLCQPEDDPDERRRELLYSLLHPETGDQG